MDGCQGQVAKNRKPQVIEELDCLSQQIHLAEEKLGGLRQRLASVLRDPEPSATAASDEKKTPPGVSLAEAINAERRRVAGLCAMLDDTLVRLEV